MRTFTGKYVVFNGTRYRNRRGKYFLFNKCLEYTKVEQIPSRMVEKEFLSIYLHWCIFHHLQISVQIMLLISFGWYWSILYAPFIKAVCPSVNRLEVIKGHLFWLLQRPNHFKAANMWQNQLKVCQVQDLIFLKHCGVCFLSLLPKVPLGFQYLNAKIHSAMADYTFYIFVQIEVLLNLECFSDL